MTTLSAPSRSYEQRLEALAKANDIRCRRAALKREVKAGRQSMKDLLLCPPEWLDTMKVADLLRAVPWWGAVKVTGRLKQCGISPTRTVGALSFRQRADLARRFER